VGVQVRVTGPGVAVGERGRHQTADVDLPDTVSSLPGEQCVAFDEPQRVLHGSLMRLFDLCSQVCSTRSLESWRGYVGRNAAV
jgi:hypothetical protein